MKKQILKVIGLGSLAVLILTTLTQGCVSAQGNDNELQRTVNGGNERSLVGSWDERVTARDCQTGAPIPFIPVFPAMVTYNKGGTMEETDLGGPGIVRLVGQGVWEHQHARHYSAAFRFLNFAPDRTFLGTNVVRSTISLSHSGSEYTGTDTLEILDAGGNLITRGCSTTTATRFQ